MDLECDMVLAVVHHLEIAIARLLQLNCAQEFSAEKFRGSLTNRNANENNKKSAQLTQEGELLGVNRDQRSATSHCNHLIKETEKESQKMNILLH
jgi:phage protein D